MKKEKIRKLIITKAKDTAPLNEKQFLYHTNFEGCLAFCELFVRQHPKLFWTYRYRKLLCLLILTPVDLIIKYTYRRVYRLILSKAFFNFLALPKEERSCCLKLNGRFGIFSYGTLQGLGSITDQPFCTFVLWTFLFNTLNLITSKS